MADEPGFTVIVAAYDRGRHIVPTIESALDQAFANFDLLVVGDGVGDDTLDHVPRSDPRISVIALPWNSGSQATPNNVGIAVARRQYVAYLGHDDVWMPDHLAALAQVFEEKNCDVAVSGCAYHGPPGTELVLITGLIEDSKDAGRHFFPPTSFAHRTPLATTIGGWRTPHTIVAPVDADFLLRAIAAEARFASTRRITSHKFAAGHRYLSYLDPSSAEQSAMLSAVRSGSIDHSFCTNLINRAKAAGTLMSSVYPDFSPLQPGELFRANRSNKGIERVEPTPLIGAIHIPQSMEPRALDWYPREKDGEGHSFRWSGPSQRPKLLLPFTCDLEVQITLKMSAYDPGGLIDGIQVTLNGQATEHKTWRDDPDRIDLQFTGRLRQMKPSVVELILQRSFCPAEVSGSPDRRRLGIILTGYTIAPASPS